jgi:hypothetical protein
MTEPLYTYEILNDRGAPFLSSARPKLLAEIQADDTLCCLLSRHRHRARLVGGEELDHLPGFPQPQS